MISPPHNLLVSYHYFRKYDMDKLAAPGIRIIGDSGAYSARMQGAVVTNSELAAWIKQWRHRLCWAASLDIAGDVPTTRRNWHELVDNYGVPAVSSLHVGVDPSEMDYYAKRGVDFLGLGGMAGSVSPIAVRFRWLVTVFQYARRHHPQMRFHGWGVTNTKTLRLPFWSVDSSGWGQAYRFGSITLRDPHSLRDYKISLDGRSTYAPEVARLLREEYGVNPSQVATSGGHNRKLMVKVAALSASVQEQRLRRLHRNSGLTAPTWGQLNGGADGPHLHLVGNRSGEVLEEITALHGPHLHLAEGSSQNLELITEMNQ